MSLKLATQELVSNNCTVGKVRIKVTKLIPAGRVYGQSLAGTGYPYETKVNLTVAQHPKKKKKKHAKHGSKHHKAKRLKRVRYRKANKATVKASFCAEPRAAPRINAAAYHEPGRAWLASTRWLSPATSNQCAQPFGGDTATEHAPPTARSGRRYRIRAQH